MYRAGIEGIIGLSRAGQDLVIDPCFPTHWPEVSATVRHAGAVVEIAVENPGKSGHGIALVEVDGVAVPHVGGPFSIRMRGDARVRIVLGGV